jgi:DHA3 family tetracycline resistance protein-like MFS transporter
MHHSHEALDRAGGLTRSGLLTPLRERDFRLLWSAMCISLLGDGAFLVALAWQVYVLSDAPTALSVVGIAMTVPTILFLLVGGVASDRLDRRSILIAADVGRGAAVGMMAVLAVGGWLELWHLVALAAVYGTGSAFFAPAFDAFVPDLLRPERLAQANALDQLVRPLALRLVGPALGGVVVGVAGASAVFALDAASFAVSCAVLLLIRAPARRSVAEGGSVLADLRAGWRYVRERSWLWATFASAAIAYLLFMGPVEVLLPYVVKHPLHGDAADLGMVFAAGGLGSVICAVTMGRRGLPRRTMTVMYVVWTLATLAVAGYGLASAIWQLMLASLAFNALETAGTIIWATVKQRHVPGHLLGRVSSLDWLISIGLLPLSFALTGPAAAAFGAQATLVGAGILGAMVTAAALVVPGTSAVEEPRARSAAQHPVPGFTQDVELV